MSSIKQISILVVVAASAAVAQQPQQATPPQAAPPNPQAQQAAPAAPAHHAPQAKTQEEYAAFQQAVQQQDPEAAAKAADDFAAKYPQSELRAPLYQDILQRYYSAQKPDMAVTYGRKTLQIEPNNPLALGIIARVLAERTTENDVDRNERLNEAIKDAEKMIATIDQSLLTILPPNMTAEQAEGVKKKLLHMAWDAEGKAEMELQQDAKAQQAFEKALQYAPDEARTRFRLALTLDRQNRYPEALAAVNQALPMVKDDAVLTQQLQQEQSRLQQLTGSAAVPPPPANGSQKPPRQ